MGRQLLSLIRQQVYFERVFQFELQRCWQLDSPRRNRNRYRGPQPDACSSHTKHICVRRNHAWPLTSLRDRLRFLNDRGYRYKHWFILIRLLNATGVTDA